MLEDRSVVQLGCRLPAVISPLQDIVPGLSRRLGRASGGYAPYLRRIRRIYERQVASMSHAVRRYFPEDTRLTRPAGGFVLCVELTETVDSLRLHKQA